MATFGVAQFNRGERIAQKASRRGMSINHLYGQYAVTFSPERIDQLRRKTGKLKPGVIALCGTLDEVNDFLKTVSNDSDESIQR
jgi:hypothetical protein